MGSEIKLKEIKGLNINGKLYECDPSDYGMMHGILYHFPGNTRVTSPQS